MHSVCQVISVQGICVDSFVLKQWAIVIQKCQAWGRGQFAQGQVGLVKCLLPASLSEGLILQFYPLAFITSQLPYRQKIVWRMCS